jgi:hypothetical protein
MKWMRERDLLIAQTMAFVQSVTGKKPDAGKQIAKSDPAEPDFGAAPMPDIEAFLAAPAAPPRTIQIARTEPREDFQAEIRARVATFRAHQERFHREREAYCSATMAKVHAALKDDFPSARLGK